VRESNEDRSNEMCIPLLRLQVTRRGLPSKTIPLRASIARAASSLRAYEMKAQPLPKLTLVMVPMAAKRATTSCKRMRWEMPPTKTLVFLGSTEAH